MSLRTKIYTAHEKPETAELADRVILVREGFSFWAFLFSLLWLLSERLWLASLGYFFLLVTIGYLAEELAFNSLQLAAAQLFLQVMLGCLAYDLKRWTLARHGYRMTGIVAAETDLNALRRYYDAYPAVAQ